MSILIIFSIVHWATTAPGGFGTTSPLSHDDLVNLSDMASINFRNLSDRRVFLYVPHPENGTGGIDCVCHVRPVMAEVVCCRRLPSIVSLIIGFCCTM